MKNIELKVLDKEDRHFLTSLHISFCQVEGKESKTRYHNFVREVATFKNKGYNTAEFDHYVEMYRNLKECCGECEK